MSDHQNNQEEDIIAKSIRAKNSFAKHLCECKCVLPQFSDSPTPRFHQFVVFSKLDENMDVIPHLTKCNYCGSISRTVAIGVLEPQRTEHSTAIETSDEIKDQLPPELLKKLGIYADNLDLATLQEIRHVLENDFCWGVCPVILAHETDQATGTNTAKVLNIMGKTIYNVRTVSIN